MSHGSRSGSLAAFGALCHYSGIIISGVPLCHNRGWWRCWKWACVGMGKRFVICPPFPCILPPMLIHKTHVVYAFLCVIWLYLYSSTLGKFHYFIYSKEIEYKMKIKSWKKVERKFKKRSLNWRWGKWSGPWKVCEKLNTTNIIKHTVLEVNGIKVIVRFNPVFSSYENV